MVGQQRLMSELMSYDLSSFPHSCAFIGPKGCGKHTAAKEVAEHLGIEAKDIGASVDLDAIDEIYATAGTYMYVIDMTYMMERQQNVVLKLLEEPLSNTYVAILAEGTSCLLPTVANRCRLFEFAPYSTQELASFLPSGAQSVVAELCQTPGQAIQYGHQDVTALKELCNKMVSQFGKACYPNALGISKRLNYKDEYDKYDVMMFLSALSGAILEKELGPNADSRDIEMARSVSSCRSDLAKDPRLNKESRVLSCLSEMWRMFHGGEK